MIRRQIQSALMLDQHSAWNAFVDLLAMEDYEELTEVQKSAHLVFWYDAEVQNGGHLQYFLNSAGQRAEETLDALGNLKLDFQKAILAEAISLIAEYPLPEIETVDDYVAEAMEDKFGEFDSLYYACEPSAIAVLEDYLKSNFNEFIKVI